MPRTGVAEGVNDSSEKFWADGNIDNLSSSLDSVAFLDGSVGSEDGDTDVVGLQVEAHSADAGLELNHLLGCRTGRKHTCQGPLQASKTKESE